MTTETDFKNTWIKFLDSLRNMSSAFKPVRCRKRAEGPTITKDLVWGGRTISSNWKFHPYFKSKLASLAKYETIKMPK